MIKIKWVEMSPGMRVSWLFAMVAVGLLTFGAPSWPDWLMGGCVLWMMVVTMITGFVPTRTPRPTAMSTPAAVNDQVVAPTIPPSPNLTLLKELFDREYQQLQEIWTTPTCRAILMYMNQDITPITEEDYDLAWRRWVNNGYTPELLPDSGTVMATILTNRYSKGYEGLGMSAWFSQERQARAAVQTVTTEWLGMIVNMNIPYLNDLFSHPSLGLVLTVRTAMNDGCDYVQNTRGLLFSMFRSAPEYVQLDVARRASRYPTLAQYLTPYRPKRQYWDYENAADDALIHILDDAQLNLLPARKDLLLTQWRIDRVSVVDSLKVAYGTFAFGEVIRRRVFCWVINALIQQMNPHGHLLTESELHTLYCQPMEDEFRRLSFDLCIAEPPAASAMWYGQCEQILLRIVQVSNTRPMCPSDGIELIRARFSMPRD